MKTLVDIHLMYVNIFFLLFFFRTYDFCKICTYLVSEKKQQHTSKGYQLRSSELNKTPIGFKQNCLLKTLMWIRINDEDPGNKENQPKSRETQKN